jgi:phage-related protein
VVYVLAGAGVVALLHVFVKKAQKTPQHNIEIAQRRLKEVVEE